MTILADAGVPMLFVEFPVMLFALVPVIAAEFLVAKKYLSVTPKSTLKGIVVANLVSTIFGFPLLWILLVVAELSVGGGGAHGLATLSQRIYAVTVQAPWLIPYESDLSWMIPVAGLYLLIPAFFVSVFLERWVCQRLWKNQNPEELRKFSWIAHIVSYPVLLILSLIYYHAISKHG